jgi:protein gp37
MNNTKIEWTDMTWNPIIGCHKISPGCDHCYAERMANRISHMDTWTGEQYRNVIDIDGKWNWETHLADSHMDFPRTLKKPRKIFVGSMTDIFLHSQTPDGRKDVVRLFNTFRHNHIHTFQILTKRPHEMKLFMDYMKKYGKMAGIPIPLPNVWLGVTVCNQEEADFKIPILLHTPAAKRFISVEPMLGPIDLSGYYFKRANGDYPFPYIPEKDRTKVVNLLDWIICGAETGPGARLIKWEWVYSLLGQAQSSNIPFFFKSWGKLKIEPNQIDTFKQFPK